MFGIGDIVRHKSVANVGLGYIDAFVEIKERKYAKIRWGNGWDATDPLDEVVLMMRKGDYKIINVLKCKLYVAMPITPERILDELRIIIAKQGE
jgi:hypothetical protein